jgi:hypothetical protein
MTVSWSWIGLLAVNRPGHSVRSAGDVVFAMAAALNQKTFVRESQSRSGVDCRLCLPPPHSRQLLARIARHGSPSPGLHGY